MGISITHSGHAEIYQNYGNTQATKLHMSYPPLRNNRVVLLFLLAGFGFDVEDLMLGLGMRLRFVLH